MSQTTTLIATARNEGPFLLEWVAYHRAIGFDHIVIVAAPSLDGSDALLTQLAKADAIIHVPPDPQTSPAELAQHAFTAALSLPQVRGSTWVLALDISEYLNIRVGKGTLVDLHNAIDNCGDCDALCINQRVFGNAGQTAYKNRLLLPRFTRAAPEGPDHPAHRQFNTLARPGSLTRFGPQGVAFQSNGHAPVWRNASGDDITDDISPAMTTLPSKAYGQRLAQVNHYAVRGNAVFALQHLVLPPLTGRIKPLGLQDHAALNCNHVSENTITRWAQATTAEIKRLQSFQGVQAAHKQTVVAFEGLVAQCKKVLASNPNDRRAALFDTTTAKTIVARQTALARNRRTKSQRDSALRMVAPNDLAPSWLADQRHTQYKRGWYFSDDHFAVQMTTRSENTCILSFDCSDDAKHRAPARNPWGYEFIRDAGWSHMGVMALQANWYRDPRLYHFLSGQVESGVFKPFEKVVLVGAEMGGYAAAAFAALIPDCTVLAFAPQSTLAADLVPWETRFATGRQADWSGPYRDAAQDCAKAQKVYIFSDPGEPAEQRHAARFIGENVTHLDSWFAPTLSAAEVKRTDIVGKVLHEAIAETLTPARFYNIYRGRRTQRWYPRALADRILAKGHHARAAKLAEVLRNRGQANAAQDIENRL